MKLNSNEAVWAPKDHPKYLVILRTNQRAPDSREQFLQANVRLLERLQQEASPEEVEEANRILENHLEPEVLEWLPKDLLHNSQTPQLLMDLPKAEGGNLHEWIKEAEEMLQAEPMRLPEVVSAAEQLTLPDRVGHMLLP